MQGNCTDAIERIPEHLKRGRVSNKHCIIDFQNAPRGFEVPFSSSLWLSDLVITNTGPAAWILPDSTPAGRTLLQASRAHSLRSQTGNIAQQPEETIFVASTSGGQYPPSATPKLAKQSAESSNEATADSPTANLASPDATASQASAAPDSVGGAVNILPGTAMEGGKLYAQRVIFSNNHAENGGAVGMNKFALAQIVDCVFDSNSASGHGGMHLFHLVAR